LVKMNATNSKLETRKLVFYHPKSCFNIQKSLIVLGYEIILKDPK